jgi:hypothetical protein
MSDARPPTERTTLSSAEQHQRESELHKEEGRRRREFKDLQYLGHATTSLEAVTTQIEKDVKIDQATPASLL